MQLQQKPSGWYWERTLQFGSDRRADPVWACSKAVRLWAAGRQRTAGGKLSRQRAATQWRRHTPDTAVQGPSYSSSQLLGSTAPLCCTNQGPLNMLASSPLCCQSLVWLQGWQHSTERWLTLLALVCAAQPSSAQPGPGSVPGRDKAPAPRATVSVNRRSPQCAASAEASFWGGSVSGRHEAPDHSFICNCVICEQRPSCVDLIGGRDAHGRGFDLTLSCG